MSAAADRFLFFVALSRARNTKRRRFALLIAALIAVLLWQTQWLSLRPGLATLLTGQIGSALILLYRNRRSVGSAELLAWFDQEKAFLERLALFENGLQMIGFLVLAFGLWSSTRNLWMAIALGIVYPATAYFGLTRRSDARAIEDLKKQKKEIQTLLQTAGAS
jgi:hypothetical protein